MNPPDPVINARMTILIPIRISIFFKLCKESLMSMKILYISSENVPGNTGGSVRTLEISKSLKRLGHGVIIFTNREGGQKRKEVIDGVKIIRSRIKFGKTLPALGIRRLGIFKKDFDIVVERYSIFGGLGAIYSKLRGTPLVLEVNAPHLEEALATRVIKGKLVALLARRWKDVQLRTAAKIITTKKALAHRYEEKAVEMVLGGVNLAMFRPGLRNSGKANKIRKIYGLENNFVAVFHGAFTRWHGIIDLMKAAKIIEKRDKKIKFLFVGGGELEEKARLAAGRNCIFAGNKDYSEIPYYLAACDAGIAPYGILPKHLKKIGFYWNPMKIFEYIALGLPVVTADYKELRDIVGGNGVFYNPGNYKDLAEAVLKIKSFRGIRKNYMSNAKKYSWGNQAKQLEKILEEIIEQNRK